MNLGSHAIYNYTDLVSNMDDEEYQEYLEAARSYNDSLIGKSDRLHSSETEKLEYQSLLAVNGSSVMGTVEVPAVDINLPVYHGTSEETLQAGAGHLEGSSLPVGGIGTHAVITGHRGLPSARLFTDLDKVAEDDYIIIRTLNEKLTYQVDTIRIVLPSEIDSLAIDPERDLVTLVTCTPYGINSHRLLITGHRVENLADDVEAKAEARLFDSKIVALFIAIPILIGLFIWLMVRYRKPKE